MNIKKFLNKNENKAEVFSFTEFQNFYKTWKYNPNDITILKYSSNNYIIQFHKFSKSQIIIKLINKLPKKQSKFLKSIIDNKNFIDPRKQDVSFWKFLFKEIILRYKSLLIILFIAFIMPYLSQSWLLLISKNILEICISLLGVYFALMIVFLTIWGFKYSEELFINWKLSYYLNMDKNLAKLCLYSILYLIIILLIISLFWNKWYFHEFHINNIAFIFIWFGIYLLYINFINLIDFYIEKISYLQLSNFKNQYFIDNYKWK